MIRRPPRSTRVRSSAASDVYKRQHARRISKKSYCAGPNHGDCGGGKPVRAVGCRTGPHASLCRRLLLFYVSGAPGSGGTPFMGKGVLPNGPAAPSLENHLHGPALQRINTRGRTVGIAAGASQYEPPVAARAPTLFLWEGPLAFLRFRRRGKWRDPFYGKRGPAKWARSAESGKSPSWARSTKN